MRIELYWLMRSSSFGLPASIWAFRSSSLLVVAHEPRDEVALGTRDRRRLKPRMVVRLPPSRYDDRSHHHPERPGEALRLGNRLPPWRLADLDDAAGRVRRHFRMDDRVRLGLDRGERVRHGLDGERVRGRRVHRRWDRNLGRARGHRRSQRKRRRDHDRKEWRERVGIRTHLGRSTRPTAGFRSPRGPPDPIRSRMELRRLRCFTVPFLYTFMHDGRLR